MFDKEEADLKESFVSVSETEKRLGKLWSQKGRHGYTYIGLPSFFLWTSFPYKAERKLVLCEQKAQVSSPRTYIKKT